MGRSRIPRPLVLLAAFLATTALARGTLGAEGSRHRVSAGPGVEGHVLGASGLPIAGARVVAWRVNHETRAQPLEVGTTRSDEKGGFLLRRLGAGTFEIEVQASGYERGRIGVHLPEGSTSLFPLEVSLAAVRSPPSPSSPLGATMLEARRAIEGGDLRRAQALLAGVDAIRPEDADVFYAVGEGLLRAGETAEAVAFFEKALLRDPSHVAAHYRLALGFLGLGRNAEARAEFEKVLELRTAGPMAEGARRALRELDASPKGE
jgi:hypothetical protein